MQCVNNCRNCIWPTNNVLNLTVDPNTSCAIDRLPSCPDCHDLARPNVLMFNDESYLENRKNEQISHYNQFKVNIELAKRKLLIIELGAGRAVPTVRCESERVFIDKRLTAHLIRINPSVEHSKIDAYPRVRSEGQAIELPMDALTALTLIDQAMKNKIKRPTTSNPLWCCGISQN